MAPSSIVLEEKDVSELYESLPSVKVEGIIPVSRFRSKKTGLTVCLAEIEGPVVNGYFCLATEAHDDDGLPHTLEHLIFLGSDLYPYKGVLDLVANRCLASGTNAWTDIDHTCYTVVTAGAEGFLQLLPIYLDHVLYPVLNDASFITEVHHINGEGEDAGVVYCEMQGRENTGESLTQLAVQRAMYPEPSGYRSETGGIMKNLRESTTNEKVRKYHATFYRPENLCVVVTGQVELLKLIQALQPFEERILSKHVKSEFTRPWQTPVPPLADNLDLVVPYPCDDEKNGLVIAAWRGPHCTEISTSIVALQQLLEYLTDTAISPLQREFVEQADPFCTKVNYSFLENLETCFCLVFENVPKQKLPLVKERLMSVIKGIGDGKEPIDMNRMKTVVRRKMLGILSALETDPHEIIAQHLIGDFLYGAGSKDLEERVNQATILRGLMEKPADFWLDLLQRYMLDNKLILAEGNPSRQMMEEMAATETKRVATQREQLGENGLKEKEEQLQEATEKNEIPPPEDMISSIPVPNTNSIHFHSVKRSTNHFPEQADNNPLFALSSLPMCFILDDVRSNFVQVTCPGLALQILNIPNYRRDILSLCPLLHWYKDSSSQLTALLTTDELSPELRLYLPLLMEVIDESPILRDGILIPHEEVIAQLAEDTVHHGASLGVSGGHGSRFSCGPFAQLFQLTMRVELERYSQGVRWLRELLFSTQFTAERLKIVASKMINSVAHMKRTGYVVAQSLMKDLRYGQGSNHHAGNMMRQHTFLSLVLLRLEANPQQVIDDMNQVRNNIVSSDNLTISMAADIERLSKLTSPLEPWYSFFASSQPATGHKRCLSSVKKCLCLIVPRENCPASGAVVGVGAVESSYLMQSAPCLNSYNHPDLPAVMVLLQYLTQLEGPMWRQIRGLGLAYGYSIPVRPDEGSINLLLYKCSHVVSAYKEAKRILEQHINGEEEWDEALLDSARSSLIFEIIEREKSVTGVCHESLLSYYQEVGPDYSKELLEKVSDVTVDDLRRVGPLHVAPLVNEEQSRCAICCHSSKVDEVVLGFKDISRNLTVIPSLDDSFLNVI